MNVIKMSFGLRATGECVEKANFKRSKEQIFFSRFCLFLTGLHCNGYVFENVIFLFSAMSSFRNDRNEKLLFLVCCLEYRVWTAACGHRYLAGNIYIIFQFNSKSSSHIFHSCFFFQCFFFFILPHSSNAPVYIFASLRCFYFNSSTQSISIIAHIFDKLNQFCSFITEIQK